MLILLLKLSKINLAAGKTFIFHKLRWDMMSQQFDKLFNSFSDLIISILLKGLFSTNKNLKIFQMKPKL